MRNRTINPDLPSTSHVEDNDEVMKNWLQMSLHAM